MRLFIMKKILCLTALFFCILLASCGADKSIGIIGGADGPTAILVTQSIMKANTYKEISAKEAKKIMDSVEEYVILDVREQDEFNEGHIPGAMLLPYTNIPDQAEELLPDKKKTILVYCRSGRRSKLAADSLVALGYTNVVEFGGIIDWPYEIVK